MPTCLNFGLFASPERNLIFDVNDFDETHTGPWEWDVKRLAASVVIAGRDNGFSDGECRDAAGATARRVRGTDAGIRRHEQPGRVVLACRPAGRQGRDRTRAAAGRSRTIRSASSTRASAEPSIGRISRRCPSSPSSSTASAASSTCRRSCTTCPRTTSCSRDEVFHSLSRHVESRPPGAHRSLHTGRCRRARSSASAASARGAT